MNSSDYATSDDKLWHLQGVRLDQLCHDLLAEKQSTAFNIKAETRSTSTEVEGRSSNEPQNPRKQRKPKKISHQPNENGATLPKPKAAHTSGINEAIEKNTTKQSAEERWSEKLPPPSFQSVDLVPCADAPVELEILAKSPALGEKLEVKRENGKTSNELPSCGKSTDAIESLDEVASHHESINDGCFETGDDSPFISNIEDHANNKDTFSFNKDTNAVTDFTPAGSDGKESNYSRLKDLNELRVNQNHKLLRDDHGVSGNGPSNLQMDRDLLLSAGDEKQTVLETRRNRPVRRVTFRDQSPTNDRNISPVISEPGNSESTKFSSQSSMRAANRSQRSVFTGDKTHVTNNGQNKIIVVQSKDRNTMNEDRNAGSSRPSYRGLSQSAASNNVRSNNSENNLRRPPPPVVARQLSERTTAIVGRKPPLSRTSSVDQLPKNAGLERSRSRTKRTTRRRSLSVELLLITLTTRNETTIISQPEKSKADRGKPEDSSQAHAKAKPEEDELSLASSCDVCDGAVESGTKMADQGELIHASGRDSNTPNSRCLDNLSTNSEILVLLNGLASKNQLGSGSNFVDDLHSCEDFRENTEHTVQSSDDARDALQELDFVVESAKDHSNKTNGQERLSQMITDDGNHFAVRFEGEIPNEETFDEEKHWNDEIYDARKLNDFSITMAWQSGNSGSKDNLLSDETSVQSDASSEIQVCQAISSRKVPRPHCGESTIENGSKEIADEVCSSDVDWEIQIPPKDVSKFNEMESMNNVSPTPIPLATNEEHSDDLKCETIVPIFETVLPKFLVPEDRVQAEEKESVGWKSMESVSTATIHEYAEVIWFYKNHYLTLQLSSEVGSALESNSAMLPVTQVCRSDHGAVSQLEFPPIKAPKFTWTWHSQVKCDFKHRNVVHTNEVVKLVCQPAIQEVEKFILVND